MFDVRAVRRMFDSTSIVNGVVLHFQLSSWTFSALVVGLRACVAATPCVALGRNCQ